MNPTIRYYLAAYNFAAFAFWLLYFLDFVYAGFTLTTSGLLLLNIAQSIAVLEIIHASVKWVKSPVVSTAAQVASRILVLVLIDIFYQHSSLTGLANAGLIIVSVAWSITEVVRYLFYFFNLLNYQAAWLLWMRYSFFIVLYPLGVTGEWFLIVSPVISARFAPNLYTGFTLFLVLAYGYYFPVLYKYMWKQRRDKLR